MARHKAYIRKTPGGTYRVSGGGMEFVGTVDMMAMHLGMLMMTLADTRRRVYTLEKALKPFAAFNLSRDHDKQGDDFEFYTTDVIPGKPPTALTVGDMRRARRLLKKTRKGSNGRG